MQGYHERKSKMNSDYPGGVGLMYQKVVSPVVDNFHHLHKLGIQLSATSRYPSNPSYTLTPSPISKTQSKRHVRPKRRSKSVPLRVQTASSTSTNTEFISNVVVPLNTVNTDHGNLQRAVSPRSFASTSRMKRVQLPGMTEGPLVRPHSAKESVRSVPVATERYLPLVPVDDPSPPHRRQTWSADGSVSSISRSSRHNTPQTARFEAEQEFVAKTRMLKRTSEIYSHRVDRMYYMKGQQLRVNPRYEVDDEELNKLRELARARQNKQSYMTGGYPHGTEGLEHPPSNSHLPPQNIARPATPENQDFQPTFVTQTGETEEQNVDDTEQNVDVAKDSTDKRENENSCIDSLEEKSEEKEANIDLEKSKDVTEVTENQNQNSSETEIQKSSDSIENLNSHVDGEQKTIESQNDNPSENEGQNDLGDEKVSGGEDHEVVKETEEMHSKHKEGGSIDSLNSVGIDKETMKDTDLNQNGEASEEDEIKIAQKDDVSDTGTRPEPEDNHNVDEKCEANDNVDYEHISKENFDVDSNTHNNSDSLKVDDTLKDSETSDQDLVNAVPVKEE